MRHVTKRAWLVGAIAAVAVIAVIVAILVNQSGGEVGGEEYPPPKQPDPAIAQGIADTLEQQPGVSATDVTVEIECIGGCKGQRPKYLAEVQLAPDVTAEQIVALVAVHDQQLADVLPEIFDEANRNLVLAVDEQHTFTIRPVHPDFAANHAQAFLNALPSPNLEASYGAHDADGSTEMVMLAQVEAASCDELDAAMSPVITVLPSASLQAQLASPVVRFKCPGAYGDILLMNSAEATTGWSAMANEMADFREKYSGPGRDVIVQDFYISGWETAQTTVTVEINQGKTLPAEGKAQLESIAKQLKDLGALGAQVEIKQF